MTIEEAINELQEDIELYIPLHGTIDDVDRELPDGRLITALEMAIKSLEALEKVKTEIVERTKHLDEHDKEDMRELVGILSILASITEHLQEVTDA